MSSAIDRSGHGHHAWRTITGVSWYRENLLLRLRGKWPAGWSQFGTGVSTSTMDAILFEVHLRTGRGLERYCFAFDHEIASAIGKGKDQVNLATRLLRDLGFQQKTSQKRRRKTVRSIFANEYAAIDEFVNGRAALPIGPNRAATAKATVKVSRSSAATERDSCPTERENPVPPLDLYPATFEHPSPPDEAGKSRSVEEWKEVEEELKKEIGDWRTAINAAIEHGVSASEVLGLIAHYRDHPGAWLSPGILWRRIQDHAPGDPTDKLWPTPQPKFLANQRQIEEASRPAESAAPDAIAAGLSEAETKERAQRETLYGPVLDGMSPDDVCRLAGECCPLVRSEVVAGNARRVRHHLLFALEKRGRPPPGSSQAGEM